MPFGSGPGPIAPDGSAVAMYAALPAEHEVAAMLHRALPAGGSVLDLGAGTGRLAGPLVALGHPVVAVDNSPDMLAHIQAGTPTVCADITSLALAARFSGVVVSGFLLTMRRFPVRSCCGCAVGTWVPTAGCCCSGSRRSGMPVCVSAVTGAGRCGSASANSAGWTPTGSP
jgi:SAM-dependent methyltransferase